jgi:hypothetical protein
MPQNIRPDGAPINPLAEYQKPNRAACSSRFHHDDVIKTKPGFTHDSKTPMKKRAAASVENFVADPEAASVAPRTTVR